MKKIVIKLFSLFTLFVGVTSCEDQLDINRDPDSLSQSGVAVSTEFPAATIGIVGPQGSYAALIGGFWSQYWTQSNAANQYKSIDDYSILGTSGTINGLYRNMFDALGDARNVKRIALEQENWNYYLMSTVLEAYGSQLLVDFFDVIPYEEANNPAILLPQFNDGPEVYDLMIADLDDALSRDLAASMGETPAGDDLIFGGDMSKWVAFANTLKLKIYLRQENARPGVTSSGINSLLTSSATFLNADAAVTQFEDAPDKSNPLYESNERQLNTPTNLRASTTLFSYLQQNGDPRLSAYYEAGNSLNQGDFNSTAAPNGIAVVNLMPTTAVYLLSREESLFMQAEAQLKYGSDAIAKEKYDAAVIEAISKFSDADGVSLDGSPFIATGGEYEYPTGSEAAKLKAIIMQKWVSGFPGNGFEAFFDTNRTGYPEVSSVSQSSASYVPGTLAYSIGGTTGSSFPKRLPFPSDVRARNTNAPGNTEVTVPVWWVN